MFQNLNKEKQSEKKTKVDKILAQSVVYLR